VEIPLEIIEALEAAIECIGWLEDQQAMPDDGYLPLKQKVQDALDATRYQ
jgi:hypothetical protein